jgi:hypothetical protein
MRTLKSRLTALWGIILALGGVFQLKAQGAESPAVSGGLDTWTALMVIVILVIALGGLVIYELVVRTRA